MRGLLALFVLAFAATTAAAGDVLFDAIAAGDKAAVEQALADGADVNSRARDQATPLIDAALDDQLAIAELLLSKGADVMARNSGGFTPSTRRPFPEACRSPSCCSKRGRCSKTRPTSPASRRLMVAGEENHVELAEFLIAQGADVNHPEAHGYWPITRAFWKGNTDIIKLFKRHGATCQAMSLARRTLRSVKRSTIERRTQMSIAITID